MRVWWWTLVVGAALIGPVLSAPAPAAADHVSVGVVVWVGDGEVLLRADAHYHVLAVTDRTVLVDELGQAVTGVRIGDTVQEHCVPAPGGGFAAVRIEVILPARPSAALGET